MKTMNLKFNMADWKPADEDKDKTLPEITKLVVTNVLNIYAQQKGGLQEGERRHYYKILDAIEAAVKAKAETVDLEDDWFGFLRQAFRDVRLAPGILIRKIEELIEAVNYR